MLISSGDLNDSKRESAAVASSSQLSGERLAELLSAISEAPDFVTAATFMLAQFADIVGARRGVVVTLDSPPRQLITTASIGFETPGAAQVAVSTQDLSSPLTVSALSLHSISCDGVAPLPSLPFGEWTSIPFPQPQFRGAPQILTDSELDIIQLPGCKVRRRAIVDRRRKLGHAPGGVLLLEASIEDDILGALMHAASLAGPVLARMAAVEEFRLSTGRLDAQREMLTTIMNSLPDPIVIINADRDIVVQNQRAEHLLSTTDKDSEGRRRAVEINNLLFTSHLSKAAMGSKETGGGSRESDRVDPDEGTDRPCEAVT